jgi:hypothetical protein
MLDLASHGAVAAVQKSPGLKLGVNVAGGHVTYEPVALAAGLPMASIDDTLGPGDRGLNHAEGVGATASRGTDLK